MNGTDLINILKKKFKHLKKKKDQFERRFSKANDFGFFRINGIHVFLRKKKIFGIKKIYK